MSFLAVFLFWWLLITVATCFGLVLVTVYWMVRDSWCDRDARRRIVALLEQETLEQWFEMPAARRSR